MATQPIKPNKTEERFQHNKVNVYKKTSVTSASGNGIPTTRTRLKAKVNNQILESDTVEGIKAKIDTALNVKK